LRKFFRPIVNNDLPPVRREDGLGSPAVVGAEIQLVTVPGTQPFRVDQLLRESFSADPSGPFDKLDDKPGASDVLAGKGFYDPWRLSRRSETQQERCQHVFPPIGY
jgi:hypothetical protein